ncbi:MAG TPA: nucleotide exchange factor GrpE [Coleofasciculaceae cyanobacterium]
MSDRERLLKRWMVTAKVRSWRALADAAQVSMYQVRLLRQGNLDRLRLDAIGRIAKALGVTPIDLLGTANDPNTPAAADRPLSHGLAPDAHAAEIVQLQQEYHRLKTRLENEREQLLQEFERSSLQILEPWLLNWYKAVAAAQHNPQIPATNLLPLMRPLDRLLEQWSVEQIAPIGEEVAYDPQWHQLVRGNAQPGDRVRVVMPGFRHQGRLLHRAQVSLVN